MKVLIYSDVHGNLPAFEAVLKDAGSCDQYICLGDLVNYGPWSNECVDLALSLPGAVLLMGNHEEAFLQGFYPGDNSLVKTFFSVTIKGFKRYEAIRNFIPEYPLGIYKCRHTIADAYIYPDTKITLDANYIIGHSHHQFKYSANGYILYNAGSVGQDRKIIKDANYLLCDTITGEVTMKKVAYPFEVLINKMEECGYPDECIEYYLGKTIK
jgi:Calcineurin-like phosphoesterase